MIITVTPRELTGQSALLPTTPGTVLELELTVSATGGDEAGTLQFVQFDFSQSDPGVTLLSFEWLLDLGRFPLQDESLPTPSAASFSITEDDRFLLQAGPVVVASMLIRAEEGGRVNALGSLDLGATSSAAVNLTGAISRSFSLFDSNLQGGQLDIPVSTDGGNPGDPPTDDPDPTDGGDDAPPDDPDPIDGPPDFEPPGDGTDGFPGGGAPLCGAGGVQTLMMTALACFLHARVRRKVGVPSGRR